jgi:predicted AAA+ superfamily ATPase
MLPDALFDELVADAHERVLPKLTARSAGLARVRGKADVVIGMRRSGKTWFVFQIMGELAESAYPREALFYVNLDDERLADLTAQDLGRLVEAYFRRWPALRSREVSMFFDEIQVVDGWEQFARRMLDSENIQLCLTGSSAKLLSKEIATSMRGRALATEIFPFSFREAVRHAGLSPTESPSKRQRSLLEHALGQYLEVGGFPEAQEAAPHLRRQILQGYLDVVILRDVIERHAVSNATALRRFARQLMNQPGGLMSVHRVYNDLRSQGFSVSKDTLHAFLDHLTDAYLFFTVPIDSDSERVRQTNPRKVYCIDPGLVRACTSKRQADVGHLLETFVFLELRRRAEEITYCRSEEGFEGDFRVRLVGGDEALVQVCAELAQPETRARELRATEQHMDLLGLSRATIVTLSEEETIKLGRKRIEVVPAWRWALGLDA